MIWQFRPDAPGEITGAKIIKLRSGQTEMIQGVAQMFDVEGCVMRDHEVGARRGQPRAFTVVGFPKTKERGGKPKPPGWPSLEFCEPAPVGGV